MRSVPKPQKFAQTFPGAVFDGAGRSLWPGKRDLRQCDINANPHRAVVLLFETAAPARVWLLSDRATFDAIPSAQVIEAIRLMESGHGILMMARHPAPIEEVQTGVFRAAMLWRVSSDVAGHA